MNNYSYSNPTSIGFKKVSFSRKQHNILFPNRKLKWCNYYEYYFNGNTLLLHEFVNIYGIIAFLFLYPLYVIYAGFANINDVHKEYKFMINQKKYGYFSSDSCTNKDTIDSIKKYL